MQAPSNAFWIGPAHPFDLHEVYLDFRYDIVIAHVPSNALIHITADSRYRLWINGEEVDSGPARSWPQAQQVDVLDISVRLRPGRNAIAAQVYSPGYSHFAYVHRGACGFLAWIEIDGQLLATTDTSWRVRRNRSWSEQVSRVSIYGSGVEVRDMALDDDWQSGETDIGTWTAARIAAPAEGFLWQGLRQRDVPLLKTENFTLGAPRFYREGFVTASAADPHDLLRAAWAATQPAPIDATQRTCRMAPDEARIWVFDLGESCICRGEAEIARANRGETLLVSYAEKLRDGEVLLSDPSTYCRMRPTDRFTLRAGPQTAGTFSPRGGRYIIFCLLSATQSELTISFRVQRMLYPLDIALTPLPDPALDRIQQMCARTIRNCLQDGFVDSVWRESSQWLGDGVAQAFAFEALSGDLRPLRRLITMAGEGAYADGILPSVLPGEVHAYTITDYNFSWIELLHAYCERAPGAESVEFLVRWLPVLERMLQRFEQDEDEAGLLLPEPGRRLFLDWSGVSRAQPNLTYNGRYLYGLMLAAGLVRQADHKTLSRELENKTNRLRTAMRSAFQTADGWRESPENGAVSQLALALLILTDTVEAPAAARLAERIVARSLDLSDESESELAVASPFMHHYIFLALDHIGRWADIEAIIRARWGRWAEAGEPTTWENWNVDFPDGSVCHGFSAHPLRWLQICAAHRTSR